MGRGGTVGSFDSVGRGAAAGRGPRSPQGVRQGPPVIPNRGEARGGRRAGPGPASVRRAAKRTGLCGSRGRSIVEPPYSPVAARRGSMAFLDPACTAMATLGGIASATARTCTGPLEIAWASPSTPRLMAAAMGGARGATGSPALTAARGETLTVYLPRRAVAAARSSGAVQIVIGPAASRDLRRAPRLVRSLRPRSQSTLRSPRLPRSPCLPRCPGLPRRHGLPRRRGSRRQWSAPNAIPSRRGRIRKGRRNARLSRSATSRRRSCRSFHARGSPSSRRCLRSQPHSALGSTAGWRLALRGNRRRSGARRRKWTTSTGYRHFLCHRTTSSGQCAHSHYQWYKSAPRKYAHNYQTRC